MSSNKKNNRNFLKRLELQGFKSFASKTVFDFSNERSVGIVGPNGSGKSNIIDAIRWVLGETGASRLRGDVLKNLIFAGTPKKSASGLAKATIVFDNSERVLPIDADEVSITRKIDRSGTSDFYLNDQSVRLKDLEPLFARAKLGSRGLMIIGQGQYDVIVRSSPKERREMIEEVLGLKEFRIKKHSAERRLKRSQNNMEKIQAKIEEIAPHLKFLKKQQDKWEKKEELEDELKNLSKDYFSHHYHTYKERLDQTKKDLSRFREKEKEQQSDIEKLEKVIDGMSEKKINKEQISKIRDQVNKLDKERNNLERKLARLEAEKEYKSKTQKRDDNKEKDLPSSSYLVDLIKSFVKDIAPAYKQNNAEQMKDAFDRWFDKLQSVIPEEKEEKKEKDDSGLDKKIENARNSIKKKSSKIKELREKEDKLLLDQEKANKDFRQKVEELEEKKNNLRKTDQNIQNLSLKEEKTKFKMEELQNKWKDIGFDLENLYNITKDEYNSDSQKDWNKIERRIDHLKSELSSIGDIDESLIEEAHDMAERFESLTEQKEDLERASEDLRELIKNLDKKIHDDFKKAFSKINKEFNNYFRLMFGGGKARMSLKTPEVSEEEEIEEDDEELKAGVEISLNIPKKKITGMEMLSGGEKTLVSIAALFALVSVSPPPFLVLDEIDAALDDVNSKRFADLVNEFSHKAQFIIVTHNRVTMEATDALYGITMGDDGVSTVLSVKLEEAEEMVSE